MTNLIRQKSNNDCVLAAIAMAAGKRQWHELWNSEDLESVKLSRGISDLEPWLERAGLKENTDYISIYVHSDQRMVKALLWKRRALLSVESLNNNHGSHMIYWDGHRIWDPQDGVEGKIAHPFLSSAIITRCYIFKD